MEGVVRTRVGYTGGTKDNPTYRSLGDHTETLEIEFDPERISYEELLGVFWAGHDPTSRPYSRQYMAAAFYADEAQKEIALESLRREGEKRGATIQTKILPLAKFHPAEDYHQKYYLRRHGGLMREFRAMYPQENDFTSSTAAARVNGFLAGYGSAQQLQKEIDSYGLSPEGRKKLLDVVGVSTPVKCK